MPVVLTKNVDYSSVLEEILREIHALSLASIRISEEEPSVEEEGVLWYQPSTNTLRVYILD
jgi:hypothetical protein